MVLRIPPDSCTIYRRTCPYTAGLRSPLHHPSDQDVRHSPQMTLFRLGLVSIVTQELASRQNAALSSRGATMNLIKPLPGRSSRCLKRLTNCCMKESVKLSLKDSKMSVKSGLSDSLICGFLERRWYVLQMKDSSGMPRQLRPPAPLAASRAKRTLSASCMFRVGGRFCVGPLWR